MACCLYWSEVKSRKQEPSVEPPTDGRGQRVTDRLVARLNNSTASPRQPVTGGPRLSVG